ncbi:tRNA (adenosine(37)-N6)-threonylcarbamoyltransferase complex dimerization subunit type 1 TsaB [Chromatium okenii]|jgi:tRNA threonylcarbamoyladenosine biosynthesis protein TsaB|uniref:tRNA threonylcarbamoyladenosine biosynthesis protein TsaB n=1 Tax=Chromatium okenii TaxID=61644 RepID=A0A2S7XUC7_9GAMM|nr:tRNA (adenosine(37)-N6)-threonylcarbamoyltransferase complex dimerization subunit type 1 TsaB [Chromatium okenii]PQJ97002.1 tRNA (adenosine(37)-N6)-threonylcarbamoyltransferase complex dimerization subunit type 1 TsaB [Chromatium okenii]
MKLLAIDTSGDACSAALLLDGAIEQVLEIAPRRHGERILPMMQMLLEQAGLRVIDLDALAFGRGPGSFTGVRMATAVIQGAAFAANLPVVAISTLAALAQGQFRRGGQRHLLTALDARMGEVYWGCFTIDNQDLAVSCAAERVCSPSQIDVPNAADWCGVGSGFDTYTSELSGIIGHSLREIHSHDHCEAQDVAMLAAADFSVGRQVAAEYALPIYLRDQVTR